MDGLPVLVTLHPAYLLRVPDAARRTEAMEWFTQDLSMAARAAKYTQDVENKQ